LTTALEYKEFLRGKQPSPTFQGVDVSPSNISPLLFDFQKDIVLWGLELGKFACFADCGLGKTAMQLEWCWQVCNATGGNALIVAPLAVAHQTYREGQKFGRNVTVCRTQEDVKPGINITNYEMLDKFDPSQFIAVALDESSILKSENGSTKMALTEMFRATPYKSAWTATPSPNDHTEIGNHSDFLGIMPAAEMLARWFINDTFNAGEFRLKNHGQGDFWAWVCSWAVSLTSPADLGYPKQGYDSIPLEMNCHVVDVPQTRTDVLFNMGSLSATKLHDVARASAPFRAEKVAELVESFGDEPVLIWCNTEYEANELRRVLPRAVEVKGSDTTTHKESRLVGFSDGSIHQLITKPKIAGFGMNWQHCRNVVFMGLSYSYESFYQSLRRCWRYGQQNEVRCHVVIADGEQDMWKAINQKQIRHKELTTHMRQAMGEHELTRKGRKSLMEYPQSVYRGCNWELWNGDSCDVINGIETESVGLSVFSPPFANLFVYSDALADMGNCANTDEFIEHFRFLVRELRRVTMKGRLAAVHCQDLSLNRANSGVTGLVDFPGMITRLFVEEGWVYHSKVTIWKSPVTEMVRTKNHGLLYKNLKQNSCVSRQGKADYVVVFRKWDGMANSITENPVYHTESEFPLDQWQKWASPVWMDIDQTKVLNYQIAKGEKDEKHLCPLQLDVIERCIALWSNKGDNVLSPFAGIGSEGYVALKMGRKFTGIELKPSYFEIAKRNLESATISAGQQSLETLFGAEA